MRLAARIAAVLGALLWGIGWYGLIDLLTVFVEGEDFAADYIVESGWGLVFLVLVAVPLVGLAVRPGTVLWVRTVVATGVALGVAGAIAGSPPHLLQALAVVLTGVVVGWLGRTPWRTPLWVDQGSGALAGIAILPAIAYAVDLGDEGRGSITNGVGHNAVQGGLGLAVAFACALLAVSDREPGRLLVRLVAAVPAVWIGVESVLWPDRTGSVGEMWGWLLVAWGVLLLAAHFSSRVLRR